MSLTLWLFFFFFGCVTRSSFVRLLECYFWAVWSVSFINCCTFAWWYLPTSGESLPRFVSTAEPVGEQVQWRAEVKAAALRTWPSVSCNKTWFLWSMFLLAAQHSCKLFGLAKNMRIKLPLEPNSSLCSICAINCPLIFSCLVHCCLKRMLSGGLVVQLVYYSSS